MEFLEKIKKFEIDEVFSKWFKNQTIASKYALISALIIGFISHLFVYTGRYFGNHDVGLYGGFGGRIDPVIESGRWFNRIITRISYDHIMPLLIGIFVSIFLAITAFYICKIFNINKKVNAIIIGGLLATFPSIAFTNLFLYDTANYHFGVMLAVLAVYVTKRFKFGFFAGAILIMLTLAIYQAKFNVAITLCVLWLIVHSLETKFNIKDALKYIYRFILMIGLGTLLYVFSMYISFNIHGQSFGGNRGFSPDSVHDRVFSLSGFFENFVQVYRDFFASFLGDFYPVTIWLYYSYIILAILAIIYLIINFVKKGIYKNFFRMSYILFLLAIIPFVSNFAGFLATDVYGLMIYSFVLFIIFCVILSEITKTSVKVLRTIVIIFSFIIITNYTVGNNYYYLRAYFFNQRMMSLTTRLVARIDYLLPQIQSDTKEITFFGVMPNRYHQDVSRFLHFGRTKDGGLNHNPYILFANDSWEHHHRNITGFNSLHGVPLQALTDRVKREEIRALVISRNMPVWPASGSIDIINDVIVINFGL